MQTYCFYCDLEFDSRGDGVDHWPEGEGTVCTAQIADREWEAQAHYGDDKSKQEHIDIMKKIWIYKRTGIKGWWVG